MAMFWTIVGAILFVLFLPLIIGVAFMLIPYALILLGLAVAFLGHGSAVLIGLVMMALGVSWAVSMASD